MFRHLLLFELLGPLCFIQSTLNAATYQKISEHFMEMLISFSSRALAPVHGASTTTKWFVGHVITELDWPANSPDLTSQRIRETR